MLSGPRFLAAARENWPLESVYLLGVGIQVR